MIRLLRYVANLMDTPQSRGTFGEMIVASIFDSRFFGEEEHYIINNIILESPGGKIHQIDHVVIYKTGVFCIETKNIEGVIIGSEESNQWKIYNGKQSYDLFNPIMQNKVHVSVLSEFLGWKYPIHSIVVFIKGNKPKECTDCVLNLQELKDYVKGYSFEKELSSDDMRAIFDCLTTYKEESVIDLNDHITNTKAKH